MAFLVWVVNFGVFGLAGELGVFGWCFWWRCLGGAGGGGRAPDGSGHI